MKFNGLRESRTITDKLTRVRIAVPLAEADDRNYSPMDWGSNEPAGRSYSGHGSTVDIVAMHGPPWCARWDMPSLGHARRKWLATSRGCTWWWMT